MTKKKPKILTPKEIYDSMASFEAVDLLQLMLKWDISVSPRVHVRDSRGYKDRCWWHAECVADTGSFEGPSARFFVPQNWFAVAPTPLRAAKMCFELVQTLTGGWADVSTYAIDEWKHCRREGTLDEAIAEDLRIWGDDVVIPKFAHEAKTKKERENWFVKKPNW